ncbi:MAG: glycosyltransferase family 4 protein [Halobacteriota archaeon]
MRIGLVIYGSLDKLTGGYLYDRILVTYLQEHGSTVEIVSLPEARYPRHLLQNFSARYFQRLTDLQVDVLVQDELNHPSLFMLNRRLRERVSYPIVSLVHLIRCCEPRPAWQNAVYRQIERRYLSSVDGFIFNSVATRVQIGQLLSEAFVRGGRSIVAHPGRDRLHMRIDEAQIEERAHDGILRLLFVGNIIPLKGLHLLVQALAQIPNDRWTLTVIGNTDVQPAYTRAVLQQLNRNNLGKRVSFMGAITDAAELSHYLRSSHVLVVPSAYEGYGIVYAEGMGYGLPAIGAKDGGAQEIITHRKDGLLVPPGDVTLLKSYLAELIDDRALLLKMSLNARRRYESLPTWEESMRTIDLFLATLVHDENRSD